MTWTPENIRALSIHIHGRKYGAIQALHTEMKTIDNLIPDWSHTMRCVISHWMTENRNPSKRNQKILDQVADKYKF